MMSIANAYRKQRQRAADDEGLWGTERTRGELLKLGIVVSNRSIRRYRWQLGTRAN